MGENVSKIGVILSTKMTITLKIGNLVFLSIRFRIFHVNLKKIGNFEQKKVFLGLGLYLEQVQNFECFKIWNIQKLPASLFSWGGILQHFFDFATSKSIFFKVVKFT